MSDELLEAVRAESENRLVDSDEEQGHVIKKTVYGNILYEPIGDQVS